MRKKGNSSFYVGIDLMGCDSQPYQISCEITQALSELPSSAHLVLFGTQEVLQNLETHPQVKHCIAEEVITMDEDPLYSIRRKKNSSLCVGIRMLKEKHLDAFISAGNTGALVASATLSLSRLPGIERVALLTLLPTKKHPLAVLDVGASHSAETRHLLQYAAMGSAYQKSRGIENPRIGLLNIGIEPGKGTPELQEAYQQLKSQSNSFFIGNIEGRDVFNGDVDVLVTDGFTGNVFLKTSEGISSFILEQIEHLSAEENSPNFSPVLTNLRRRLHYAEYPGAVICGVDGIVMKCHGDGSPSAFRESLKATIHLLENNFLDNIKTELLP